MDNRWHLVAVFRITEQWWKSGSLGKLQKPFPQWQRNFSAPTVSNSLSTPNLSRSRHRGMELSQRRWNLSQNCVLKGETLVYHFLNSCQKDKVSYDGLSRKSADRQADWQTDGQRDWQRIQNPNWHWELTLRTDFKKHLNAIRRICGSLSVCLVFVFPSVYLSSSSLLLCNSRRWKPGTKLEGQIFPFLVSRKDFP